jgi:sigma-B regulation protein RsbU (phosphoserine phosphatase)
VHQALRKELESTEMYLTLFYCVLDLDKGLLTYANAGNPHAFGIRGDGIAERLGATDPPLGMVPLEQYGEATVPWDTDKDLLFLFTDGLSDAFGAGDGTGEGKLIEEVLMSRREPVQAILTKLFEHAENAELSIPPDDRSAVLVHG